MIRQGYFFDEVRQFEIVQREVRQFEIVQREVRQFEIVHSEVRQFEIVQRISILLVSVPINVSTIIN